MNDESVAHAAHIEQLLAQVRQDLIPDVPAAGAPDAPTSQSPAPDDEGRGD